MSPPGDHGKIKFFIHDSCNLTVGLSHLFIDDAIFEAVIPFYVSEDPHVDNPDQLVFKELGPALFVLVLKYAMVEFYLIFPK